MALAPPLAFSVLSSRPSLSPTKLLASTASSRLHLFPPPYLPLSITPTKALHFRRFSTAQEIAAVEEMHPEVKVQGENMRKLFVFNFPWSFSASDIRNLFSECGTVEDVEIIKQKNGRHRGYAFVTMATGEEASATIEKFNSSEVKGRVIRVEYAKSMKKPSTSNPEGSSIGETWHKIYISNLSWKARSSNLREFFAPFNPISARVVFDSPSGGSAGYGFASFSTKEDAEAAISALDGQELMGRPVRLKLNQKNVGESGNNSNEEDNSEGQLEQS